MYFDDKILAKGPPDAFAMQGDNTSAPIADFSPTNPPPPLCSSTPIKKNNNSGMELKSGISDDCSTAVSSDPDFTDVTTTSPFHLSEIMNDNRHGSSHSSTMFYNPFLDDENESVFNTTFLEDPDDQMEIEMENLISSDIGNVIPPDLKVIAQPEFHEESDEEMLNPLNASYNRFTLRNQYHLNRYIGIEFHNDVNL